MNSRLVPDYLLSITADTVIDAILGTTYFRWALLLFAVLVIGSILSGLIDITLQVIQYGVLLLIILGILEFVGLGLLT